jgi:drug/metabolite transporter (DMT)-like permease
MNTQTTTLSTPKISMLSAWGILIILALIWGSSFILMKKSLMVFSSMQMAFLRVSVSFVVFLPLIIANFTKFSAKKLSLFALSGLLGMAIPAMLFAIAQKHLDSGIAGILNGLTPLCTLLIGFWFFKQKTTQWQIIGLLIAFCGAVLLSLTGTLGKAGLNVYVFLIFLATICYAINVHLVKKYLSDVPPVVLTSMALWFGGLCCLVGLAFVDLPSSFDKEGFNWACVYIITLSVGSTAIATTIFNFLIQKVSPLFASTVTYLIPIVALMWGLGDGEFFTLGQYLSMLCVLGGLFLMNKK